MAPPGADKEPRQDSFKIHMIERKKVCEHVLEPRRGADAAIRLHIVAPSQWIEMKGRETSSGGTLPAATRELQPNGGAWGSDGGSGATGMMVTVRGVKRCSHLM